MPERSFWMNCARAATFIAAASLAAGMIGLV